MLEVMKYTNHMNETLTFGKGKLYVNESDLHDFAWSVTSKNDKISGFKKGIVKKSIPVILKCDTAEEGVKLRNQLFEVFEKDVLAQKHGKISIGDYYLKCFVTESKKKDYLIHKSYLPLTLTVQTDQPEWIRETTFSYNSAKGSGGEFLDFNYDFPVDYMNELAGGEIVNPGFVASDFRMTVYGACVNPVIYINGHEYSVAVTIESGEYLTVDSRDKTIVLTRKNGEQVNCFNLRNKDSYIFQKIPAGANGFTSSNDSIWFSVTLLEERSEPKWT